MSEELTKTNGTSVERSNDTVFGSPEGSHFLQDTLNQNFKQVKETQIAYKVEDIERELNRRIQDAIIDLKRKARQPQDDLIKLIPTSPMQQLKLSDIDEREFCNNFNSWALDCHNRAQKILCDIRNYQALFGKMWNEDEKNFVKSMVIDFRNI